MKEQNDISSFDNLFRDAFENVETSVPQGVWEGIAASTGGAASSTSLLAKLLGIKNAALIVGGIVITGAVIIALVVNKPSENNQNVEEIAQTELTNPEKTEVPKTIAGDADVVSNTISTGEDENTSSLPSANQDDPYETPPAGSNATDKADNQPIPKSIDGSNDETPTVVKNDIPLEFDIVSADEKICVDQSTRISLFSTQALTTKWMLNGRLVGENVNTITVMFNRSGVNTVKVIATANGQSAEKQKIFDVQEMNAEFIYDLYDNNVELKATNVAASHQWFFDQVKSPKSGSVIRVPKVDKSSMVVSHITSNLRGCSDTFTQKITLVSCDGEPVLYEGFSPHLLDGINDEWVIELHEVETYYLTIFASDGSVVFHSTDQNVHWNGRRLNQGELMPVGTYTYQLVIGCNGTTAAKSGKVRIH